MKAYLGLENSGPDVSFIPIPVELEKNHQNSFNSKNLIKKIILFVEKFQKLTEIIEICDFN